MWKSKYSINLLKLVVSFGNNFVENMVSVLQGSLRSLLLVIKLRIVKMSSFIKLMMIITCQDQFLSIFNPESLTPFKIAPILNFIILKIFTSPKRVVEQATIGLVVTLKVKQSRNKLWI